MTNLASGRKVVMIVAALGVATLITALVIWQVAAPERERALGRMFQDAGVSDASRE